LKNLLINKSRNAAFSLAVDASFFAKLNTTDLPLNELPYDYNSILHADANYRALNASQPTLIPLRKGATLGKATGLSPTDILKLNTLYC
jgi:hypothetical protein